MVDNFTWREGHPPPKIEPHSDRKLQVIERYLEVYFDTVARNPRMDRLNITIVDAFCGGGVYQASNGKRFGSPIALLNSVRTAAIRLNIERQKPLIVDAEFLFSDEKREHVEYLRELIKTTDHADGLGKNIHLRQGRFEQLLPDLIAGIKRRQRRGRSLFVLDQFGYGDVPMSSIREIFQQLDRAEVLLTFSIDALLNYLGEAGDISDKVGQFGIDGDFLKRWTEWKKDERLGRSVAQRTLMTNIHQKSGARFFTPFMLFSSGDNRWMMVAHLSQNQAARDKMLSVHWSLQNRFKHLGKGSHFELGFDHRNFESSGALFNFAAEDRARMQAELQNELPDRVFRLMRDDALSVQSLLEAIGNNTAATNDDIFDVLTMLSRGRELQVLKADGGQKRWGTAVTAKDTLVFPAQRYFPLR